MEEYQPLKFNAMITQKFNVVHPRESTTIHFVNANLESLCGCDKGRMAKDITAVEITCMACWAAYLDRILVGY